MRRAKSFAYASFLTFDIRIDCDSAAKLKLRIFSLDGLVTPESLGILLLSVVNVGFLEKSSRNNLGITLYSAYGFVITFQGLGILVKIDIAVTLKNGGIGVKHGIIA